MIDPFQGWRCWRIISQQMIAMVTMTRPCGHYPTNDRPAQAVRGLAAFTRCLRWMVTVSESIPLLPDDPGTWLP